MDTAGPFAALKRCEEELRKFAAEAAGEGDYDRLARLGVTARTISEIAHEWQVGTREQINSAEDADSATSAARRSAPDGTNARARGGRAGAGRGYPRFMRRGDEIVKVGWSKGERKEYQHRAPHSLLLALRQAMLDASKRRKLFTMDTLERHLAANGMPGYQAYVWLAWLRSADLVKQHGRQGYSVIKPATFEADVEKVLGTVPIQEL
jgi:hypothetical protein